MEFVMGMVIGLSIGVVLMGVAVPGSYKLGFKNGGKKHD